MGLVDVDDLFILTSCEAVASKKASGRGPAKELGELESSGMMKGCAVSDEGQQH